MMEAELGEQGAEFREGLVQQGVGPRVNEILWHYLGVGGVKRGGMGGVEVFHSWDYLQPPDKGMALVSTIHDLAILKYPEVVKPEVLRHHRRAWEILREREAEIIAVSEATKGDVVELLGIPAERVHLVYEALPRENLVAEAELSEEKWGKLAAERGVRLPFFLFVGTREPRKNLERLIQAWWEMREESMLVLVGEPGWSEPKYEHENLLVMPHLSQGELGLLYSRAMALTYPSLDEGFGIPILEAYHYGTLVVTSGRGATAEVAGWGRGGWRGGGGRPRGRGGGGGGAGRRRLEEFSWTRAAEQTEAVYRRAWERFTERKGK